MSYKDNPPKTIEELKSLSFDERARLWAKYSQCPFKRQIRSLWYYIQCDRLNLRIEHKYLVKIRKYKDNPEQCLDHACPNKYNFVPGTVLTRYFKGIKYTILVNDDGSFSYNGDEYSTLSAVATKIAGMKMSGNFFFGINKRYKHLCKTKKSLVKRILHHNRLMAGNIIKLTAMRQFLVELWIDLH